MKLTIALFAALIGTSAAAETDTLEIISKIHCQSNAELMFSGWNTDVEAETVGSSVVRFMTHSTDENRALRQQTTTIGQTKICVQTELAKTRS